MRRKDDHDRQGWGGTEEQGRRGGARGQAWGRQGETGGETVSPLPVFLFPSELVFYGQQRATHRRVLTLYNPYSFGLSFSMLCTTPSLYRVVEAEGSVRAKSCVDLVVRHLDVSPQNWGRRDCFRLRVRGGGQVGVREIWAELRGGEEGGEKVEEEQKRRRRKRPGGLQQVALSAPLSKPHLQLPTCTAVRSVSQWVVCVLLAVLCVTVLMLPLHPGNNSMVPPCLHVSTNQKLACAYTLGLLTVVFLR